MPVVAFRGVRSALLHFWSSGVGNAALGDAGDCNPAKQDVLSVEILAAIKVDMVEGRYHAGNASQSPR